ncbi:MAG: hypothetical protein ACK56J_16235 [Planctomycetota bacterium]|jgi:hypothetical protein
MTTTEAPPLVELTMFRHTIALAYFFLAVLCVHVSYSHRIPILLNAAMIAAALGCIFFFTAVLSHLGLVSRYIKKLIEAAQPPSSQTKTGSGPI